MSATIALSNYGSPHAPTQPHSVGAPRFQPQANNSSIARSPAPLARVQTSQKPALPSSQAVAKPLPGLCSHSSDLSREDLTKTFATVALWSKQLQQDAISPPTKKRKLDAQQCSVCRSMLRRPTICLSKSCKMAFCSTSHAQAHCTSQNHPLSLDVKTMSVYCTRCDDILPLSPPDILAAFDKREQGCSAALHMNSRGFLNLGATCYLSVVLQCFLRTNKLRDYYLSNQHDCALCEERYDVEGIQACMSCEMDKLFTSFYSKSEPASSFALDTFLYAFWRSTEGSELARHGQQDGHEFLVSLLTQIHSSCAIHSEDDCPCIIHQTFAGQFRSEVRCDLCGKCTVAHDPFLEVTLNLSSGSDKSTTLRECLETYTKKEQLRQYSCQCGSGSGSASKQLRFETSPAVLCVAFKRFEQSMDGTLRKVEKRVKFPLTLDLGDFVHQGSSSEHIYDLYGVIVHEGEIHTGHYTNFVRNGAEWQYNNDTSILSSSLSYILAANPYILLYSKR